MSNVINKHGLEIDFNSAVNLMDTDLCAFISVAVSPCSAQCFFEAYCENNLAEFGTEFECNKSNPVW